MFREQETAIIGDLSSYYVKTEDLEAVARCLFHQNKGMKINAQ